MTHDYSSTHVDLSGPIGDAVKRFSSAIPDDHLGPDGRESHPHVTLKYGLHTDNPDHAALAFSDARPGQLTLGKTSLFTNDDAHVLKISVESPDLVRLNSTVSQRMPHTDTHSDYTPHLTIAYLKPDPAISGKYDGRNVPGVTGQTVPYDKIVFSSKNGHTTDIPLGQPQAQGGPMKSTPHSRPEETKSFTFEFKSVEDDGTFTGYASVFGNEDSAGDIVVKGAFADSLKDNGGIVPILWNHDPDEPLGWNLTAREDDYGLLVKGKFTDGDPFAERIKNWIRLGLSVKAKVGLSIGYNVLDKYFKNGVRYLKTLKWMEYSPVVFAANSLAMVTDIKGAVGFQSLAVADESRGWDTDAARGRIWQWARTGEDKIDFPTARKCFLWYDVEAPEEKRSYKFPIADIVDGEPKVVFAGLEVAAKRIDDSDIPEAAREAAKATIARYYKKFGKENPFQDKAEKSLPSADPDPASTPSAGEPITGVKAVTDFKSMLESNSTREAHLKMLRNIQRAHGQMMDSIYNDTTMDIPAKKAALKENIGQMASALCDWHTKNLDCNYPSDDGMGYKEDPVHAVAQPAAAPAEEKKIADPAPVEEEPVDETKSGRVISAATKSRLAAMVAKMNEGVAIINTKALQCFKEAEEMCSSLSVEAPTGDGAPAATEEKSETAPEVPPPAEVPAEEPVPAVEVEASTEEFKSILTDLSAKFAAFELKAA